ncbi:putative bifunctional diguanylate cyclase/phosphodiesterase [Caldinitratiruptor microaerophilus]|uniref:Diguanylate cyclase (GGDEF) domain-containing protein n=1 Tax=Caldinitratiruptor microaerophilus TaxID=671077 RepID=A0AA35G920_9FIRM|nr:EAL domain-containing protein [Caldinitratiruptor microaerophilus]BDG61655.1 hypothetical protein caldi_27450 [Caldinitratiruptor microaerophilus]
MSIRTRVILGTALVALPLIVLAVGLSIAVLRTTSALQASVEEVNVEARWLIHLQQDSLKVAIALHEALEHGTPAARDRFAGLARALDQGFDQALAAPFALARERDLVRAARDEWQAARAAAERLLAGLSPGPADRETELSRFQAHLDRTIANLEQADDLARREMDRQLELVRAARTGIALLMILVLGVGPGMLLVVGGYVDRILLNPVRALQEAARRFGEGDLSYRLTPRAADELGELADTFNAMAEKIERELRARGHIEKELRYLADHDALTGLYNRRRFQQEVEARLERSGGEAPGAAVLFLDLDDFKEVNDSLGHRAGDEVLARVGRLLRAAVRATDIPARVGGDEFAVFLPSTGAEEAQAVAQRLVESIRRHHFRALGRDLVMTASVGIALYPEHGTTTEELLARADLAMYQSKSCGNRFCLYIPERDGARGISWLNCEAQLRDALEKERFVLFCQPILDLRQGRVTRYELLLRMKGEGDRLVGPGTFLPVAERSGLIHDIDRWVIRQAIRLLSRSPAALPDLCLEVNLSGKSFADGGLVAFVGAELEAAGVEPGRLIFEITETALIPDLDEATGVVLGLRQLGCQFALDDFGRGFSSLFHLKHLPVDYLKIDGAFVESLPHHPVDQHLVRAIVEAARGVGARTVAEYVRDGETLALLRDLGVDYAQGYHVGPPVPVERVLSTVCV